jgi:hypothetical protein
MYCQDSKGGIRLLRNANQLKLSTMKIQSAFLLILSVVVFTDQIATAQNQIPVSTNSACSTFGCSQIYDNATNVGIGIGFVSPAYKLHLNTNLTNDGIRIDQTGKTAAALYMVNTYPGGGGRTWGLFSTGMNNSQGAGNFIIMDITGGERLFIQGSSGNIGIGNTLPSQKLSITGSIIASSSTNPVSLSCALIQGFAGFSGPLNPDYTWNGDTRTGLFHPAVGEVGLAGTGVEAMRINSAGNVGIGNPAPLQKVHLTNGNFLIDGVGSSMLFGETPGSSVGEYGIEYDVPSVGGVAGLNFWKPWGSHNGSGGQGFLNYALYLNDDGNVGIGVQPPAIDPNFKLSVCGAIRAKEIRVNTGWCDFVFEKNYTLQPLCEVEDFTLQNGHLPNIPAGASIEANGADVGFIISKQMQSIEELYLHLFELYKKVEALENENAKLKCSK